ncbi:MAG: hypothetical protein GX947_06635 [Tissierellia bacterium]|nr:hypothetical protein [Tissierellia bacterium]
METNNPIFNIIKEARNNDLDANLILRDICSLITTRIVIKKDTYDNTNRSLPVKLLNGNYVIKANDWYRILINIDENTLPTLAKSISAVLSLEEIHSAIGK